MKTAIEKQQAPAGVYERIATLQPATASKKDRKVRAVIATDAAVPMWDWERMEYVDEVLVIEGAELPGKVPLVDTHRVDSVQAVLGSTRDFSREAGELLAWNYFGSTDAARDAFDLVQEGHVTDNSIRYLVTGSVSLDPGTSKKVNGRAFTAGQDRPLRVSTNWKLIHNCICPHGADSGATMRGQDQRIIKMQNVMTPDQTEQERVTQIRQLAMDQVPAEDVDRAINEKWPVEKARGVFLESVQSRRASIPSPRIRVGSEPLDTLGDGLADAILQRAKCKLYQIDANGRAVFDDDGHPVPRQPHGRAREFFGQSLPNMARAILKASGVTDTDRMSNSRAVKEAVSQRAASTMALPDLLSNVMNKFTLASYLEYPVQWPAFARPRRVPNFKEITLANLSQVTDLTQIQAAGAYEYISLVDNAQKFTLKKFGKIVGIPWESWVNDDLDAFQELPRKLGAAGRRKEDDLCFTILTANGAMDDDSVALFHADHNNLAASGAGPTVATFDAAVTSFRKQKGSEDWGYLNLQPATVIVPAALESAVRDLYVQEKDPDDTTKTNPYRNMIAPIVHPILDDDSAVVWYMAVAPVLGGTALVELAFLESEPHPVIEEEREFDADVFKFKVRHSCAAVACDFRAGYKNPGV